MTINKKREDVLKTLVAVSTEDKLNVEDKKTFEFMEKDNHIYFFIHPKIDEYCLPYISMNLKKVFKKHRHAINVDLDSFTKWTNETVSRKEILNSVLWWVKFYEKDPYTKKTKNVIQYEHNLMFKDKAMQKEIDEINTILEAQEFCRKLQDTPSRELSAEIFVDEVKKLFKPFEKDVEIKILDLKDMKKKKMGLILGVNAGSVNEPRLLSIKYMGNSKSKDLIGFIGKGITFDMGGSNLKTGTFMRWMKFDMSGAAIVMSALYALVKNKEKANVVAIAALTDNAISATATRPDDILTSYNGMTVEIDNTDAEGRLVLADAITYAVRDLKVSKMVDIATLTGAMAYALGDTYTGVWSTSECQWKRFHECALRSGENVWRLPFHPDFVEMLKSPIADIKNSSNDRRAGSSRAANFLKEFTEGVRYIHLDVASTADVDNQGQAVLLKTLYKYGIE